MRLLTVFLLCALALPASAQIYKFTDDRGNVIFSDQPPLGRPAQTIELPPTNTVEAQPTANSTVATVEATEAGPVYKILRLSEMPSEEAIRANNGTFSVSVEIEPRLQSGHTLRLLLDGRPYGQPSNMPRLQLTNIDRGEHSLAVEVLSAGQSVQISETRTFSVQRVHREAPPKKPHYPVKPLSAP